MNISRRKLLVSAAALGAFSQLKHSAFAKAVADSGAFHLAREIDPQAHLMYNDDNMAMPAKREAVVAMLKDFKSDNLSWLNDFPVPGRTNYPLLFDRQLQPKAAYFRLLDIKR